MDRYCLVHGPSKIFQFYELVHGLRQRTRLDSYANAWDEPAKRLSMCTGLRCLRLRGNLARTEARFGKYLFHELISETRVGNHYVYLIYLVGYERQPVRCKLSFYKPSAADDWQVQNISFDANLIDDIEKQAGEQLVKHSW